MTRTLLSLTLLVLFPISGCQKNDDAAARVEEPYQPLNEMETAAATSDDWDSLDANTADVSDDDWYTATDTRYSRLEPPPSLREDSATSYSAPPEEVLTPTTATGQTYVVQKGDTLYKLARQFYGDQSKWKAIWEANRDRVPNPDRLYVGTELYIP